MGLTYSSVIDADRDEVAGSLRDGRATLTLPGGLRWILFGREGT